MAASTAIAPAQQPQRRSWLHAALPGGWRCGVFDVVPGSVVLERPMWSAPENFVMSMNRLLGAAALAAMGGLGVDSAEAGEVGVRWSVTIGSPFYAQPAPVYVPPAPILYRPAVPVVWHGGYQQPRRWDRDGDGIPNRHDHRYNPRWDRDGDGIPNRYDRHYGGGWHDGRGGHGWRGRDDWRGGHPGGGHDGRGWNDGRGGQDGRGGNDGHRGNGGRVGRGG